MESKFGHAELTKKMEKQFGESKKQVKVEMQYEKEVQAFIKKIEEARQKAAKSKLIFR